MTLTNGRSVMLFLLGNGSLSVQWRCLRRFHPAAVVWRYHTIRPYVKSICVLSGSFVTAPILWEFHLFPSKAFNEGYNEKIPVMIPFHIVTELKWWKNSAIQGYSPESTELNTSDMKLRIIRINDVPVGCSETLQWKNPESLRRWFSAQSTRHATDALLRELQPLNLAKFLQGKLRN